MKIVIKKNVLAIAAIFLFASFLIFAEDQPQNPFSEIKSTSEIIPTAQLLAGYLERDSDLKKLAISLQQEELSGAISKLDSGFDIYQEGCDRNERPYRKSGWHGGCK